VLGQALACPRASIVSTFAPTLLHENPHRRSCGQFSPNKYSNQSYRPEVKTATVRAISEIRIVLFFLGLKDEIRNFLLQFKSTNRGSSWQSIPAGWVYSSQRYIANHYTVPQWIELAELARRNNFDQVWINDNLSYRNVFVILTAISSRVPIKLGTAILVPYFRNPGRYRGCIRGPLGARRWI